MRIPIKYKSIYALFQSYIPMPWDEKWPKDLEPRNNSILIFGFDINMIIPYWPRFEKTIIIGKSEIWVDFCVFEKSKVSQITVSFRKNRRL